MYHLCRIRLLFEIKNNLVTASVRYKMERDSRVAAHLTVSTTHPTRATGATWCTYIIEWLHLTRLMEIVVIHLV